MRASGIWPFVPDLPHPPAGSNLAEPSAHPARDLAVPVRRPSGASRLTSLFDASLFDASLWDPGRRRRAARPPAPRGGGAAELAQNVVEICEQSKNTFLSHLAIVA